MSWRRGVKTALRTCGLYEPIDTARQAVVRREMWRQMRRERRFYRQLIRPGDLVFDIGANIGWKAYVFRKLGARVVAVEPQPACLQRLRDRFEGDRHVCLVGQAVGSEPGAATMWVSASLTISSLNPQWIEAVKASGRLADREWSQQIEVPLTTLDQLIARHGRPRFCKIDVEGYEPQVLAGLTSPLAAISFEFTPELMDAALACLDRLAVLGDYRFNWARMEDDPIRWELADWFDASAMQDHLRRQGPGTAMWAGGDLYARLESPTSPSNPSA